jgi:anti-anti-sigma regulatory factor
LDYLESFATSPGMVPGRLKGEPEGGDETVKSTKKAPKPGGHGPRPAEQFINISKHQGAGVVSVRVMSLGDRSAGVLRGKLREAIVRYSGRVVVDFSGVADVSPACLTTLMEASVLASAHGGRVVLANLPMSLGRVIETAGLSASLPSVSGLDRASKLVARVGWTWLGPIPDAA